MNQAAAASVDGLKRRWQNNCPSRFARRTFSPLRLTSNHEIQGRSLLLLVVLLQIIARRRGPTVLFICVDDLKPMLGCYGDRSVKSPNLDRLARAGCCSSWAYCNQAVRAIAQRAAHRQPRPTTTGIYDLGPTFAKSRRTR